LGKTKFVHLINIPNLKDNPRVLDLKLNASIFGVRQEKKNAEGSKRISLMFQPESWQTSWCRPE